MKRISQLLSIALFAMLTQGLIGQTTISGTITDGSNGESIIGASVLIKGTDIGTTTDLNGNYSMTSDQPLPWTLVFSYTGYAKKTMEVASGGTVNLVMNYDAIMIDQVVVSASRRPEKIINAPSSISVINTKRIDEQVVSSPLLLLKNTQGVQINQQGAGRITIELRGQSGTLFGGVYAAKDYRPLTNPVVGSFKEAEHPLNPLDLEKIEVVRGPGSALYGPGVANGVVHFISKDPFRFPGTSIELGLGNLNHIAGYARHAGHNAKKSIGYKINAGYIFQNEFDYDIFNDPDLANTLGRTRGVNQIVSSETGELLVDNIQENGFQDYFKKYSVDAALYFKSTKNKNNLVISSGYTQGDYLRFTTNNPGIERPQNTFLQARGTLGNTFGSFSWTNSVTGSNKSNLAAFYRATARNDEGQRVISVSQGQDINLYEGQVQHRISLPSLKNTEVVIGGEARLSKITGVIYGRNQGNTPYDLYGGYVQTTTPLSAKLDMTLAGRYDYYSVLDETSFAPRVAFVYKPTENGSFRASFNQAFSPAAALNYYIDLSLGPVSNELGNNVGWERLVGNTELHTYNNPQVDWGSSAGALGSPGLGLSLSHADAIAAAAAAAGITIDVSGVSATTDLSNNIVTSKGAPGSLRDGASLKLQKNQTYEIGYTGRLAKKLTASVDVYYADIENASAVNTSFSSFIGNDGLATDVQSTVAGLNLSAADAEALNTELNNLFEGNIVGAVLSDAVQADEFLSAGHPSGAPFVPRQYFSAASIDYLGFDIGINYIISDMFNIAANYSGLSKTEFEDDSGRYLLNTPDKKFRTSLAYTGAKFTSSVDFQWNSAFEVLNGTFTGFVDARSTIDLTGTYKFTDNLMVSVTGSNITNKLYQAFPGTVKIGTMVIGKVRYSF